MKTFIGILFVCIIGQINGQPFDFSNLGAAIENSVRESLAPLQNLGSQIQAQVQQGLLPLQAMTLRLQMMNGFGGVTVVQYPNGKQLLIRYGKTYTCDGTISEDGNCQGNENELDLGVKENYCYVTPNVQANDYLCFTNSQEGIFVSNYNGHVECKTQNGAPFLLIKQEDYDKMCAGSVGQKTYKYIPKGPDGVQLPINNPNFSCSNGGSDYCIFT